MKIKNHRIQNIDFQKARWNGGAITPELVTIHDTVTTTPPIHTKQRTLFLLIDESIKTSHG